jgi:peptidylprolyl isomerase
MKRIAFLLSLAACSVMSAQTAATKAAPTKTTTAKAETMPAHHATAGSAASTAQFPLVYKLPAGEHRIPGVQKKVAVLSYQDIKVGTGAEGESGKMWHVKYKGWRAADGLVFDNWEDHKRPVMGADGKPVTGADGKPKMGDPEPLVFPQGVGRMIPGFDFAVAGMRVGGKRRLFIPWELAYGIRSIPDHPDHPGIPAKSDLVFDVELVDVTDMPAPQQRPMPPMGARPQGTPGQSGQPGAAPHPNPPVEGKPVQPDAANPDAKPATPPAPGQPAKPTEPSTPPQGR